MCALECQILLFSLVQHVIDLKLIYTVRYVMWLTFNWRDVDERSISSWRHLTTVINILPMTSSSQWHQKNAMSAPLQQWQSRLELNALKSIIDVSMVGYAMSRKRPGHCVCLRSSDPFYNSSAPSCQLDDARQLTERLDMTNWPAPRPS